MKLIAPDYYPDFHCIADKCRHSCCIGWGIDIDPETRERYRQIPGPFGARVNAAIEDGEVPVFRLGAEERCPMLNKNGLCDLITELGEDALCQICADHPRFYTELESCTEVGLGMCCEEAARLILSREEPVGLITLEDDGEGPAAGAAEASMLGLRSILIGRMQSRDMGIIERLEWLLQDRDPVMPGKPLKEWAALYRGLERLDPAWDTLLDGLERIALPPQTLDTAFEQFCVYMLYRHFPGVLEDDRIGGRIKLAAYSTLMLYFLCGAHTLRHGDCTLADCIEYARMYSAEVEYSTDNIDALLTAFEEE